MRHSAAGKCTVTVAALQHADESPLRVLLCECPCVPREAVVERRGHFPLVARHRWIFVFACVEAAADKDQGVVMRPARAFDELPGLLQEAQVLRGVQLIPELLLRRVRLEVNVLDMLPVRAVDGNGSGLDKLCFPVLARI